MPDPLDWQLIDRYLAGEASPAEVADFHARATTNPDWAKALDLLRSDFDQARARPRDTDQAWSRLQSRLSTEPDIAPRHGTTRDRPSTRTTTPWLRIAVAILVAAGSLATWQLAPGRTTRREA